MEHIHYRTLVLTIMISTVHTVHSTGGQTEERQTQDSDSGAGEIPEEG